MNREEKYTFNMIQIITHSSHIPDETKIWEQLLNQGADSILLRKPGWLEADYVSLLSRTNPACYSKLMIAEHVTLCERYGLQGIHFGEAARASITGEQLNNWQQKGWLLSTGIHSADTLHVASNNWSQLLLSPVFDSISKPGYRSAFEENFRLNKDGFEGNVLALGGINHTTAGKARDMQFDGIALLGAIWENPENAVSEFCSIRDIWRKNKHS
jgi:thiamine-phosphate pyrophosphorylase